MINPLGLRDFCINNATKQALHSQLAASVEGLIQKCLEAIGGWRQPLAGTSIKYVIEFTAIGQFT